MNYNEQFIRWKMSIAEEALDYQPEETEKWLNRIRELNHELRLLQKGNISL